MPLSEKDELSELRNGHYEIALQWKVFPPDLPSKTIVAEHRLGLLKKRLIKDPELHLKYTSFMDDLFERGHAKKVPEDQRDGSPHGIYLITLLSTHKNLTRSGSSLTVPRNFRTSR